MPRERPFTPHVQPEIDPTIQRAAWVLWGVVFLMGIASCLLLTKGCAMITGFDHGPPAPVDGIEGAATVQVVTSPPPASLRP